MLNQMNNLLVIEGGQPAVSFLKYRRWPFYEKDVAIKITDVVNKGEVYASAKNIFIEQLENCFTALHCPDGHAIFCGSGTAALFTAYFALGFEPEAEILVPTNTFRATVTPLFLLNLRPVLCDSDYNTGLIDLDDAESKITSKTQGLVVTHLWGHPVDMDKACNLATKYGLALVEDCSHAHGATWREKPVGSFGDVGVFSLGTKKMVSGGTAGIFLTSKRDIFERALIFSQPKPRAEVDIHDRTLKQYLGSGFGANLRGTPIAAILALDHLKRLPQTIDIKNKNLSKLTKLINTYLPNLICPKRNLGFTSGTWYAFRCKWDHDIVSRSLLLKILKSEGMLVEKPSSLLHKQRLFYDPSPMTSYTFSKIPLCNKNDYPVSDLLFDKLIGWDTREFYEPAEEIIQSYSLILEKIAKNWDRILEIADENQ